jgi:hypothetical protein
MSNKDIEVWSESHKMSHKDIEVWSESHKISNTHVASVTDFFDYSVIVVLVESNRYEEHSIVIDITCLDSS